MKHFDPKYFYSLLFFVLIMTMLQPAAAQCPAGSTANTAGTYNSGAVVCISASVSGSITLNNGAKMVVVSGGNFTGDFNGKNGSTVEVKAGGTFKPGNTNNLASAITIRKNGIAIFGTGGLNFASGFTLSNYGSVTWSSSVTLNNSATVTNTSCGSMSFSQGATLANGTTLNNSGILTFQTSLSTDAGSAIDNRGRFTVKGDFSPKGFFKNQWQAVFHGNNTFNSGPDSLINLYTFVFKNGITGVVKMRNDGLFWVGGSLQLNSGSGIKMSRTNAQVRVNGALANNVTINGNGRVHVAGSFANNGSLTGKSASEKLFLNQNIVTGTTNTQFNTAMAAEDTTTFMGGAGNPDVSCAILLPMVVSSLKATYNDDAVNLSWYTLTESNGKKFEIEYSTDGLNFAKAGEVPAKGNSTERINYQFRFTKINSARLYFRLMMVDMDERTEYTNTIMVRTGAAQKIMAEVYPNPFAEKLDITLSLLKTTAVSVKLFDMNGRTVKTQLFTGQTGSNKWTLTDLRELNKGLYIIEITAGEEKYMQKMIR